MKLAVGTAAPVKFSQIRPTAVLPLAPRPMASNMLRHRPLGQADPASKQLDGVAVRAFAKDKDSLLYRIHGLTHSHGGALRGVPLLLGVPLVLLAAQLELIQLNPSAFWGFYMMSLEVYPFTTKLCTGVVGALLGDFLAQVLPVITARVKGTADSAQTAAGWSYDYLRAGRFALFSAVVGTPVAHLWFTFLDTVLPGTAMHTVASKVAMDQLLLCPIMTALFFAAMCALEGRAHKAVDEVRSKLVPTLKANYALWPAAHVINFAFIPSDLRILYVNVVALLWTVFLSSMAAGSVPSQQQQREAPSTGRAATPALTDLAPAPVAMPEVVKVTKME